MCDLTILKAQRIQEEYPQRIKQLEETLEREIKEFRSKEKQLEEIRKKRTGKEQDFTIEEDKVKKAKERLTEVKTNKEYQAALKQIEVAENRNSKLEEEILIIMEESDYLKRNLEKAETHCKLTVEKTEEEKRRLEKIIEDCTQEIKEQQAMKEELVSQIKTEFLSLYQKIKQKRAEPIVVPVEDSCCQGCHVNIPPQLFNEVKKCKTIIKCPHCSRILYWKKNHEAVSGILQPQPQ